MRIVLITLLAACSSYEVHLVDGGNGSAARTCTGAAFDPCTTNERCVANLCVVDPVATDDSEPCTVDGCDASGVFHLAAADGTLSLYAAFNTKTGEVLGKTAARHTSAEFVAFLTDIVIDQPRGKEIHVIVDNLSAHKSGPVKDFLAAHHRVQHGAGNVFARADGGEFGRGLLRYVGDDELMRVLVGLFEDRE